MQRYRALALFLSLLAAWMLSLAPVAAERMRASVDPFSIICAHQQASTGNSQPAERTKRHDCCLICHADLVAPHSLERPAFTRLDYPVASPIRWQLTAVPPDPNLDLRQHPPRGPPTLA